MTGEHDHRTLYLVLGAIAILLAVIGLFTYSAGSDDREATAKAAELAQKFQAAGLPVPDDEQVFTAVFGTDGGAVCENPASALGKATLFAQLTNGASFVGARPVIVDRRILRGGLLILETYCPDELADYREQIEALKTDDTLKN